MRAQGWTNTDSLRLQEILNNDEELDLNPKTMEELRRNFLSEISTELPSRELKASYHKSWLEYNTTLNLPDKHQPKVVLTLHPYNGQTKYNWDPVYQRKIKIDKNTWRGNPFYELTSRFIYTNWAKTPLDLGPRETVEQLEATGLRYRIEPRTSNKSYGSWQPIANPRGGTDLAGLTSKQFWAFRKRRTKARTLEVLNTYKTYLNEREQQTDTLHTSRLKEKDIVLDDTVHFTKEKNPFTDTQNDTLRLSH